MPRRITRALVALSLLLNAAPVAMSQTVYARLVVITLKRPLGGGAPQPLAGATVTLTNERGAQRECKADPEGTCSFGALEPGDYRAAAGDIPNGTAAPDFVDFTVRPGQQLTRTITLVERPVGVAKAEAAAPPPPTPVPALAPEPAPITETVTPGRLGVNDTARALEVLPNRDRRFAPIIDLQPGVFNSTTDALGGGAFNGQPGSQNVLREDGIDTTPITLSSASFQDTGALIFDVTKRQSFKKYKSFEVSTSNYPAELGTGTGAELIANIDKGGTKHHGEFYEYLAHDALSARNFFDFTRKPALHFNLFGFKLNGPLHYKKEGAYPQFFYFANYEGIRASSGNTLYEPVPSLSARARASAATAPLLDSFRAGGATLVTGASADPDFDILRLDSHNNARRDSFTTRIDYAPREKDSLGFLLIASGSEESTPVSVTGRRQVKRDAGYNFAVRHEHIFKQNKDTGEKLSNEFIFSINRTPARVRGVSPFGGGPDLSASAISIDSKIQPLGIDGLSSPIGVAAPGGLLVGADFAGRRLRFTPESFSFVEHLNRSTPKHNSSFGGEVRIVRATIDQLFGTTYSYGSLADLLADRASVTQVGDLGSYSGATGPRRAGQEYYIAYAQDEWNLHKNLRLAFGLRYEYYTVLREANDRAVVFDPATGTLLSAGASFYRSRKNNFLPRLSFAWAPGVDPVRGDLNTGRTVLGASFGMYTGPDIFDNLLRPIVADSLSVTRDGVGFPADTAALAASFAADKENGRFQPPALSRDYQSPALVYKFDASVKRDLLPPATDSDGRKFIQEMFVLGSYVGSRSRDLLLRNFANPIVSVRTNDDPTKPAVACRRFDLLCDGQQARGPFGEIDLFTTGGRANFDSLQLSLKGRARRFLNYFEMQYTLARNYGNTTGDDKTIGAGNPLDYSYDMGYNAGDVRQKFSFAAVLTLNCPGPFCADQKNRLLRNLLTGWTFAALGNFQTGAPIDVRIKRPDVVYVDAAGKVYGAPGGGRSAVLNVPGGGSSVAAYRPDLVPGVNPYLGEAGDRRFLNPAAFSTPAPGTLGNLPRGLLRGPAMRLVDLSVKKEFTLGKEGSGKTLSFDADVTNLFNFTNFKLAAATLPNKLGLDAASNQLQPGQPFTADAAETFGVITRTFKRQQDLGSSRQIQISVSFAF
ncbi:MAG: TonB-dependent receptor domain-containing protein [Pyrinomonadaceae bacterium]